LGDTDWKKQYDLTLELHLEAIEAAFFSNHFEEMEGWIEIVRKHITNPLDQVRIIKVQIMNFVGPENNPLEAVKTSVSFLKLLGVHFPENPNTFHILWNLVKAKIRLSGKHIDDLANLPKMQDPQILAAMEIMSIATPSVFVSAPNLLPLMIFEQLRLSLQYGNAPTSPFVYAAYGFLLCGVIGEIDNGYRFGQMAERMVEAHHMRKIKTMTLEVFNTHIRHWKEDLKVTLPALLEGVQNGLEVGDQEYGSYCMHHYCAHLYLLGNDLKEVTSEFNKFSDMMRNLQHQTSLHFNEIYQQAIFNLTESVEKPWELSGKIYNENEMLSMHIESNDLTSVFMVYFNKLILSYLFQKYSRAVEVADKAEKHLENVPGMFSVSVFHFFDSLSRLALVPQSSKSQAKQYMKKVNANQKKNEKMGQSRSWQSSQQVAFSGSGESPGSPAK